MQLLMILAVGLVVVVFGLAYVGEQMLAYVPMSPSTRLAMGNWQCSLNANMGRGVMKFHKDGTVESWLEGGGLMGKALLSRERYTVTGRSGAVLVTVAKEAPMTLQGDALVPASSELKYKHEYDQQGFFASLPIVALGWAAISFTHRRMSRLKSRSQPGGNSGTLDRYQGY